MISLASNSKKFISFSLLKNSRGVHNVRSRSLSFNKITTSEGHFESMRLKSMIADKKPSAQIFKHIVEHVGVRLSPRSVEAYLFYLMESGKLTAVVSLVHILLHADVGHYKLSNQFWSSLVSEAISSGHHGAASLIYHEIVNPYTSFIDNVSHSGENENIPFLLLPATIESLAIVLAQNGNHIAVEGVRQYFKRFYSNFGHREVYQTLYIMKVESLAIAGLFTEALSAFIALAIKYRGHLGPKDPKNSSHSLKYASHVNYIKRHLNIAQNKSPEQSDQFGARGAIKHYRPDIKFNDYTLRSGPYWAIFDGNLVVEDLPHFKSLLQGNINGLMARSDSIVDQLLAFIAKYHYTLSRFVLACLCDTGHCSAVMAIINKLPSAYPDMSKVVFFTPNDYARVFVAMEGYFENSTIANIKIGHEFLLQCYHSCQRLSRSSSIPSSCLRPFLQCYFKSPLANANEIKEILSSCSFRSPVTITLDLDAYEKALMIGCNSAGRNTGISFSASTK